MKKHEHPIDDLFREALEDHRMKPSEKARNAFLEEALRPATPPARRNGRWWLLPALLALLAIPAFWMLATRHSDPVNRGTGEKTIASAPKADPASRVLPVVAPSAAQPSANPAGVPAHPSPVRREAQQIPSNNETSGWQPASQPVTLASTQPVLPPPTEERAGQETRAELPMVGGQVYETQRQDTTPEVTGNPSGGQEQAAPGAAVPASETIIKPDTLPEGDTVTKKNPEKPRIRRPWKPRLSAGISYTPEWIFNTLETSNFAHCLGVEGVVRYKNYSFRTGVTLSFSRGVHEVLIEYNDYLGTYNRLDSIQFQWNEPNHDFDPVMYLSKEDVWDSLRKIDRARVVKRYTYLQIPMILGYDFMEKGRFTLGVRTGPILSVLLKEKQVSDPYDPGKNRVISVNDISPGQISLNWQLTGGLNASVRLTRFLRFEAEPSARYYFNSVYEKPVGNTKPWSFGLRGSFVIIF